jgi:hypothetical protein
LWELTDVDDTVQFPSGGQFLRWDSANTEWNIAPTYGLIDGCGVLLWSGGSTPNDWGLLSGSDAGQVLTWDGTVWTTGKVGAAVPAAALALNVGYDQNTSNSGEAASGLSGALPVGSGRSYLVNGLALLGYSNSNGEINLALQLDTNGGGAGTVNFDFDKLDATDNIYTVYHEPNQNINSAITNLPAYSGFHPIRFRAYAYISGAGNVDIKLVYGASNNGNTAHMYSGSWMTVQRIS